MVNFTLSFKRAAIVLAAVFSFVSVNAQITVTGATPVGLNTTYTSFTNAGGLFAALNGATVTGNLVVTITADVTNEAGTNGLNGNTWTSITINPSGARTIQGTLAGAALINLTGADNVTFNGLNTEETRLLFQT